ncbi:MAG: SPFH domain-containing protein [Chloroflexota bacterium]
MFYFLKEDEQLLVSTFTRRYVINGPGTHFVPVYFRVKRRQAFTLGPTEYLRVRNTLTGELHNEIGPKLYFPLAEEEIVEELEAIALKKGEYTRLLDEATGEIRVEQGESVVYLSPTERVIANPQKGVNIDDETAVVVRDVASGQVSMVTEKQVFIPAADQDIVRVSRLIQLEDHETVVIKERDGGYTFRHGTDDTRAFFLEPYTEIVEFWWSSGLYKDARSLKVNRLDSRPKFMWYEFEVRTKDNVELCLGITFFWQIVDVEKMIHTTDDTTGDVCSHARSSIIQAVSRVTLEDFLADFNATVEGAVIGTEDPFYDDRGVVLHAVEVRSITCKDPGTQQILNEIIRETTDRLNRLQKQESENEVRLRKIAGEIEAEQTRGDLLELQRQHQRTEALAVGESESERVRAFFEGLGDMPLENKVAIYNTLRKNDALEVLSEGHARLYFTPADVNLSIESDG